LDALPRAYQLEQPVRFLHGLLVVAQNHVGQVTGISATQRGDFTEEQDQTVFIWFFSISLKVCGPQ
jgi:hypothetical protein